MNEAIPIKVKRITPDAIIPTYAHVNDVGFDLYANEDVIIEPGETRIVPTGVALQQPVGYEIQIRPRSGVSSKTKLRIANAPGTIDQYTGEIGVIIDNIAQKEIETMTDGANWYLQELSDYRVLTLNPLTFHATDGEYSVNTYIIRKGERIAQAVLQRVPTAEFIEVNELDETARGAKGYGSSGTEMQKEDE